MDERFGTVFEMFPLFEVGDKYSQINVIHLRSHALIGKIYSDYNNIK